jgi:hypothetical protein
MAKCGSPESTINLPQGAMVGEYSGPDWAMDLYFYKLGYGPSLSLGINQNPSYLVSAPSMVKLMLWRLLLALGLMRQVSVSFGRGNGETLSFQATAIRAYTDNDGRRTWEIIGEPGPIHQPTNLPGRHRVQYCISTKRGSSAIMSDALYSAGSRHK